MSKLSQRILVSQCPSMDDLYLDYSSRTFRDRVLVAMEQYSQSQLSEYKQKLKAEIVKIISEGGFNTDSNSEGNYLQGMIRVRTLIDKDMSKICPSTGKDCQKIQDLEERVSYFENLYLSAVKENEELKELFKTFKEGIAKGDSLYSDVHWDDSELTPYQKALKDKGSLESHLSKAKELLRDALPYFSGSGIPWVKTYKEIESFLKS